MGEFRMPSLGADMETGKLVEWLVVPGQRVRRGDIVAMVETQKGLFEVEIFADGVMGELLVQPGQTVPVGTVLATIDNGVAGTGEKPPAPAETVTGRVDAQPKPAASALTTGASAPAPAATPGRIACSPSARQLALELGVDLATVRAPVRTAPSAGVTWRPRPGIRGRSRRPRSNRFRPPRQNPQPKKRPTNPRRPRP